MEIRARYYLAPNVVVLDSSSRTSRLEPDAPTPYQDAPTCSLAKPPETESSVLLFRRYSRDVSP